MSQSDDDDEVENWDTYDNHPSDGNLYTEALRDIDTAHSMKYEAFPKPGPGDEKSIAFSIYPFGHPEKNLCAGSEKKLFLFICKRHHNNNDVQFLIRNISTYLTKNLSGGR